LFRYHQASPFRLMPYFEASGYRHADASV
jgi:hypothetical protein